VVTRVFMAPRRRGMSVEAFQAHWSGPHAALARRLVGLRRYVQNHAALRDGRPLLPYAGFDCLPELDFDDLAAMDRALFSPERDRELEDDEVAFLEPGRSGVVVGSCEVRAGGEAPSGAVKLMTFLRSHPMSGVEQFEACLRGPHAEAVAAAGPLRHEQLFALRRGPAATCDAVDMIWFASPDAALAWPTSRAGAHAAYELSGRGQAVARVIVRPLQIV